MDTYTANTDTKTQIKYAISQLNEKIRQKKCHLLPIKLNIYEYTA